MNLKMEKIINKNYNIINPIKEKNLIHIQNLYKIYLIFIQKKFIVILDSDTVFKNNKYLNEIIKKKKITKISKRYWSSVPYIKKLLVCP